jgi:uncharacterized delta-60 repeat protein
VQPADQKIVVAALTFSTTSTTGIAVIRYKTDGTPDITFGTAGVVSNATVGQGLASDSCALVLQPDGKIVVAGASQAGKIVLFRYNIDGTADATFGTDTNGGSTTTSLGTGTVAMSPGLALLSDNSIIVVTGNSLDQVVLHYSTAGVLDLTFGNPTTTNGIVTTDVGGGQNFANAVAVQSGDKIVVVGHANVTPNTSDISLVRYNANGTLDTSFVGPAVNPNPPGIVVTELGAFDNAFSIALESPGTNILVSGNTGFGGGQAVVLRYTTTGALDTTFNPTSGFVTAPLFGPSNVASGNVVLQTPLGIVVAGFD